MTVWQFLQHLFSRPYTYNLVLKYPGSPVGEK